MPTMPRTSKKNRKIAYKILGKPAPFTAKLDERQEKIRQRLLFLDTSLVR